MVVAAVMMLAFLALLALVLDGGFTYWQRRNAQNAADSGALAGADWLCKYKDTVASEDIAEEYAIDRNGATTATAYAEIANGGAGPGGTVEVWANINFKSFFGRVLGLDFIDAPGYAKAGCGPPQGVAVMPVAWSCKAPVGVTPDPYSCELDQVPEGDLPCSFAEGDSMYIIADSDTITDDILCMNPPNSGTPAGTVDCDLDDDGEDDAILLGGGDRSWLDLNGGGGGAAELIDWIQGDYAGLWVGPHYWVPVQTGVTGSVYDAVFDDILNKRVVMPIFDDFCPGGPPPQGGACSALHTALDGPDFIADTVISNDPQDYYHIKAFSYWVTTCVESGGHGPCPVNLWLRDRLAALGWSNGDINSLKTMEGCFVSGNVPGLGGEPDEGIDTGIYTVFLME